MKPEELKAARQLLELTQAEMAEALGCDRRHLQRMEKGSRSITSDRTRAIENLLRGEIVPEHLRGGASNGSGRFSPDRPSYEFEDGREFKPRGRMTRKAKIWAGTLVAATGALLWWMARCAARAGRAAAL